MSYDFKVYFQTPNGEEIRRIIIPALNYATLWDEICKRFSIAVEGSSLCWKDNEGDEIRISSDKDIKIALYESNSSPFKLYLTGQEQQDHSKDHLKNNLPVHLTVICNECGKMPLRGYRYKCLVCHDYDLCINCEKSEKIHSEHPMIRISVPSNPDNPFGRQYKNVKDNIYGNLKCLLENI